MAATDEVLDLDAGGSPWLAISGAASAATPAAHYIDDGTDAYAGRFSNGNLRNAFLRFAIVIPARAKILAAELLLDAAEANALACPATVAALAPDGLWEAAGALGHGTAPNNDAAVWATTGGFVTLAGASPFAGTAGWAMRSNVLNSVLELGQAWTAQTSGALGFWFTWARRVGGSRPGVNTFLDVYAAAANDGSDDRPTGAPLATSVARGFDQVGTAFGLNGWDVRPTSPGVVAGNRYVSMVRYDAPLGAPYLELWTRSDASYAGGSLVSYGSRVGFSEVLYPEQGLLPHLYEADGATPRTAPFGVTVDVDLPAFGMVGNTYAVPGLEAIVQEWVNDPAYAGDVLGLQVAARAGAAVGAYRRFDGAQLRVLWRPRNAYVGG